MSFLPACGYSSRSGQPRSSNLHTANKFDAPPQIINQNISYRPALDSEIEPSSRPIVLIYGWLVAKSRHIYKYGDFYLGKGYDVVHIKVSPDQFLRPKKAHIVVEEVLNYVKTSHPSKPIICHGFSVGAYIFSEMLVKIHSDPKLGFTEIGQRLRGQIVDSPVDFYNVPNGVAQALTPNKFIQNAIEASLNAYLKALYNSTTVHYIRASDAFKQNQLKVPTLFLYSEEDRVTCTKAIQKAIDGLTEQGVDVYSSVFEGTPHVSHFLKHPVQYTDALSHFLDRLSLPQKKSQAITAESREQSM